MRIVRALAPLLVVAAVGCKDSGDDGPTVEKTETPQPAPAPPPAATGPALERPDRAPATQAALADLAFELPDGWHASFDERRRTHVLAGGEGKARFEVFVSPLPEGFPSELERFVAEVAEGETLDSFASVAATRELERGGGFVVEGTRAEALHEHGFAMVRALRGGWLYCEGSLPTPEVRAEAEQICAAAH